MELLQHLESVLEKLKEVQVKLQPGKCHFARTGIEVFGSIVSKEGFKPHPNKVRAIQNFPAPKTRTDIRAFVSLAGFYRRHVQGFSEIASPLNDLLKKNRVVLWGQEQQKAFQSLKLAIASAASLKYPDPAKPYKLYTDASDIGVRAVLTLWDDESEAERPICFLSRKLQGAEINYPTLEKELLAVI